MTERISLIALSSYIDFGPARIELLLSFFHSATNVWEASENQLLEVGLRSRMVKGFGKYRAEFNPKGFFKRLEENKIEVLVFTDRAYPQNLKALEGKPVALYVKGSTDCLDKNCIAIVGSRNMSEYGSKVSWDVAFELASKGITIVSGLAKGIDTQAHKAAIRAKGKTVAVFGCGLERVYPSQNFNLARQIVEEGGLLVSEYPPGYPPLPGNFAARNRIISGLSKAVVVVEGAAKSGTLLTASAAAEQGRTVFAVPGPITSPLSAAPLFLLQNGARLFTSTQDVMSELHT